MNTPQSSNSDQFYGSSQNPGGNASVNTLDDGIDIIETDNDPYVAPHGMPAAGTIGNGAVPPPLNGNLPKPPVSKFDFEQEENQRAAIEGDLQDALNDFDGPSSSTPTARPVQKQTAPTFHNATAPTPVAPPAQTTPTAPTTPKPPVAAPAPTAAPRPSASVPPTISGVQTMAQTPRQAAPTPATPAPAQASVPPAAAPAHVPAAPQTSVPVPPRPTVPQQSQTPKPKMSLAEKMASVPDVPKPVAPTQTSVEKSAPLRESNFISEPIAKNIPPQAAPTPATPTSASTPPATPAMKSVPPAASAPTQASAPVPPKPAAPQMMADVKPVQAAQPSAATKGRLSDSIRSAQKSSHPANEVIIRPLRTYEDDVKEAITSQSLSTARIMMAEQQRKTAEIDQQESDSIRSPKNKIFLFLTLILIVCALGVGGYFFINQRGFQVEDTGPSITLVRPAFLTPDSQKEIIAENRSALNVFGEVQRTINTPFDPTTVKEILLTRTQRVETNNGAIERKVTLTTEQFHSVLNTRAPAEMIRAIDPDFFFGVFAADDYNDPFLIFKVNDHDQVYGSMLQWEPQLARDMQDIFTVFAIEELGFPGNAQQQNINIGTNNDDNSDVFFSDNEPTDDINTPTGGNNEGEETDAAENTDAENNTESGNTENTDTNEDAETTETSGSSGSGLLPPGENEFNPRLFEDVVVANRDLRTVLRRSGDFVFYYTFLDEETLLMATNPATVPEIIKRLRSNRLLSDN